MFCKLLQHYYFTTIIFYLATKIGQFDKDKPKIAVLGVSEFQVTKPNL